MLRIYYAWITEPWIIKAFLLVLLTSFFAAAGRLFTLTRLLYRSDKRLDPRDFVEGKRDSSFVAVSALSGQMQYEPVLQCCTQSLGAYKQTSILRLLRSADGRFRSHWSSYATEVRFLNRAAVLMILASVIVTGTAGWSAFYSVCEDSHLTMWYCSVQAIHQLSVTLVLELLLASLLYAGVAVISRTLDIRKASWRDFYTRLEYEVLGQSR